MSLYIRAKTKVKVRLRSSEEFLVQVHVHQRSMLPPLLFAIVIDIITKNARDGFMNEILCSDNLVLMSEYMENLRVKLLKWKEAFESKGLKVNLKKT